MRVMIDTNIFVSATLFDSPYLKRIIEKAANQYTLVLCSYIIDELYRVAQRKKPEKSEEMKEFLTALPYTQVKSPENVPENEKLFQIRDKDDYIILHTAITERVDILITNDKDFSDVDINPPEILSPAEFMEKY